MSNYVKSTNFASKDSLASGNPLKIVKGTEIDTEFNNIATAVATKADSNSSALTGIPTAPTASFGTNTTQLATTAFVQAALAAMYPVGSIYSSTVSTNPATLFGFGTWVAYAAGRVLVGQDGSSYVAGTTGGSADATLVSHSHTATSTVTDPGHTHSYAYTANVTASGPQAIEDGPYNSDQTGAIRNATTGISVSTSISTVGSSATNANLQPYVVVYMWTRTA